jgi:branched-chain amino acid transport system substrate-binding protein
MKPHGQLLLLGILAAASLVEVRPALGQEAAGAGSARYGETPEELLPYRGSGEPYRRFFTSPPEYRGPGRDAPAPSGVTRVPIGIVLPATGEDRAMMSRVLNGVTLAVEEANLAGGFSPGVPFSTVVRDENLAWGGAANILVDAAFDEGVWGIVGAFEDSASHVMARLLLKVEIPLVNTGGSDPTLTEHAIPWIVRMRPDDRQGCYRLAERIFNVDGHERVVVFRSNDRYGRVGTMEFVDAARRLHHPIQLELRFESHDTSWTAQLDRIRQADPDAIVLWGRARPAGRALAAMRAAGVNAPVYGPDRLKDNAFLAAAGPAAEGVVCTYPFDPDGGHPAWVEFVKRYRERFDVEPDAEAAYSYEGARHLLDSIRAAGLNHARIRDRLFTPDRLEGVMGTVRFDATRNNIAGGVLGQVQDGEFRFH